MRLFLLLWITGSSTLFADLREKIDHIIVIYLENRSFDNLFTNFPGADTSDKPFAPYPLQQLDRSLSPSVLPMGEKSVLAGLPKEIANGPFLLDEYIPHNKMIPDMVHRFHQNKLQINGGLNDRFAEISDEKALVMGYHNMSKSRIWKYAKEYTLCDRFFASAFGGSFLNHQWLIAAQTPYVGESNISRYVLDPMGEIVKDGILTPDGYAVNTIQPFYPPYKTKYSDPALRLRPQHHDTIGDRLSEKDISWGWYSGGYNEAQSGRGDTIDYQYHHNPFLYFEKYAPGTAGRGHLKDEGDFFTELDEDKLPSVVFFKPSAEDNQHPGYATVQSADEKVSQIVDSIRKKPKIWDRSVIVITYDENGGLWDHVAPPKVDRWGPGTRIPAIVISPYAKKGYVDHTFYDTTSILRMIEWKYGLKPLGDRQSNNLMHALEETN